MPKGAAQLALFADLPPPARQRKSATRTRYIFALWPSDSTRQRLAQTAATIPPGSARSSRIKPERYHLTLAFLGPLQTAQLNAALKAGSTVDAAAFALTLDRVGYFENAGVAWIGPQQVPPGLLRLKAELDRELLHLGLPVERGSFAPHVSCLRGLDDAPDADAPRIDWLVDEFVLMRSAKRDGISVYQRLGRWPLRAALIALSSMTTPDATIDFSMNPSMNPTIAPSNSPSITPGADPSV